MYDLGLINGLIYKDKTYHQLNVYITDGIIEEVTPHQLEAKELYDCDGLHIFPGIIDPHTHFDLDLGKMKSQDDFKHGTIAAAFGGVTTIIDFLAPVDNPIDLQNEFKKRTLEATESIIDYKFHACLKNPKGNVLPIVKEMENLGLNTVKIFTTYSDSNRRTFDEEILELLVLSNIHDFLVTAHIEADDMIKLNDTFLYHDLPISRPTISESSEALKLAKMVEDTMGNLYMVHCSSGRTLQLLKEKHPEILNKKFFVESCPHYFAFNELALKEEYGYLFTMAPPLRSEGERQLLHKYIDDVYTIGTDHCTFNMDLKNVKHLKDAPLGIGGVEYAFDVMYTLFGEKIIDKMTLNVAKAHKLFPQKGIIAEGSDADLFIYKFNETIIEENHSNTDHFLYLKYPVKGNVVSTISNGNFVVKDRILQTNTGRLLNKVVKR
jgi:dihydropyrimidinase